MVYIPLVIRLIPDSETCWLPVDGQTGSADDRGVAGSIPGGGRKIPKIPKRAATASVVVCHLFLLSVLFCCLFCLSVLF